MKRMLLVFITCACALDLSAQSKIEGHVLQANDNAPLPGVNVIVKGTTQGTTTDANGKYNILANEGDVLVFSFIGFAPQEIKAGKQISINIAMKEDISTLKEVTIVSTGYQDLPKERSTGSFVQVDNSLVNRRVSTDILSRLEDVTSGLLFNRNVDGRQNDISIRGRSTIFGNATPLIVIDNFPYDGAIENINPNDVESITVLKDAAAASIWGARAGNGVIIITTKKGKENQVPTVSVNSNVTIANKQDLFYAPRMSSSEFIDVERTLFNQGFYVDAETSYNHAAITPAVEQLIANRDGLITDGELEQNLNSLRGLDVRNDYQKYLLRKSVNQQYAINLRGGGASNRYSVSTGFDKNLQSLVENEFNRVTLNANNTWLLANDKLEVTTGIYFTRSETISNNDGPSSTYFTSTNLLYPYARIADDAGNPLTVTRNYRDSFVASAESAGLLNWKYSPLDEIRLNDNKTKSNDFRINGQIKYKITKHLKANFLYQYWSNSQHTANHHSTATYYTRDLINNFTQVDADGNISYPIPLGGILDNVYSESQSHNFRTQLEYSQGWRNHELNAIAGYEVKDLNTDGSSSRLYGYDDELASNQKVSYVNYYPLYSDGQELNIPNGDGTSSLTDRFISYYGNASYSFKKRYILTASARKDQSNLFGVKTNQRGVPLWSAGAGWILSEETFLNYTWLPFLKVRTTYGYNGNIDKSVTAFTTAYNVDYNGLTGLPWSFIINPPNPSLRWEKVAIWNLGIDFELKNRVLSGSIEFYSKKGSDLIGTSPTAPSTGVKTFRGNLASTKTTGFDVVINSQNINREFKWNTTLLLSHNKEKVEMYGTTASPATYVYNGSGSSLVAAPQEGRPLYSIYSFPYAGLDPESGDPLGLFDNTTSVDYNSILNNKDINSIIYHGSAIPTTFGSIRNTFTWRGISLSVNIAYRLGYYFKRNTINYSNLLAGNIEHGDYSLRWQKPGDEFFTNVPSVPLSPDYNRDAFYSNSSLLVSKGDHIRLQDINLSYTLEKSALGKLPVSRIQLYTYSNNLGIIWKATSFNMDPDYQTVKPVRTIAVGIKVDL